MEAGGTGQSAKVRVADIESDGMARPDEQVEQTSRSSLSAIDRQYEAQHSIPKRVHILGTGSLGKLVAHALRDGPNPPPVTLIFHRSRLLEAWRKSEQVITVEDGGARSVQSGFGAELSQWEKRQHRVQIQRRSPDAYDLSDQAGLKPHEAAQVIARQNRQDQEDDSAQGDDSVSGNDTEDQRTSRRFYGADAISDEPIYNLVVTTKGPRTVPALSAVKHRLSRASTICFLQNGMGIVDEINEQLFPDEQTRPNYIQGVVTHGANVPPEKAAKDPFYVVHAGHGTISLSLLPRRSPPSASTSPGTAHAGTPSPSQDDNERDPSARYMLRALTRCPVLCAVAFTPVELLQVQLEKLAVNAILNPLTSLIDNRNGQILYNFALTRTMRLMLAEISLVIRSLPELQGVANVAQRFGADRLETLVVGVAHNTKDNISSMLADVRAGRRTEVEYINGYIVRRGEEIGIKCIVNYSIMQTVIGKSMMVQREVQDEVPMEGTESAKLNVE